MPATANFSEMLKTWAWLQSDSRFDGLPFRAEVTPAGCIVMSPTKNYQGRYQALLAKLLEQHGPQGMAFVELSTLTPEGAFEVDVAWSREGERLVEQDIADPAAEICVEVRSASNSDDDFLKKKKGYFAAGAKEVWFVDRAGNLSFFSLQSRVERSEIMPTFPATLPKTAP